MEYNKYLEEKSHQYHDNIDINNIEWIKLSAEGLEDFINKNYFDKENSRYVSNEGYNMFINPLGFHYLSVKPNKLYNYILGVTPNSIGKKTILVALVYMDKYYRYTRQTVPLTYLITIETNKYFQKQGLFNVFCDNLINFINPDQHILATKESEKGELVHVVEKEYFSLLEHGFTKKYLDR